MSPQSEPISAEARHSNWFVIVAGVFVTCLIISNIVAVKLISVEGVVVTAAITIFDSGPKPNHKINSGMSAIFGTTCAATM